MKYYVVANVQDLKTKEHSVVSQVLVEDGDITEDTIVSWAESFIKWSVFEDKIVLVTITNWKRID